MNTMICSQRKEMPEIKVVQEKKILTQILLNHQFPTGNSGERKRNDNK
jgi:hypothetical protein